MLQCYKVTGYENKTFYLGYDTVNSMKELVAAKRNRQETKQQQIDDPKISLATLAKQLRTLEENVNSIIIVIAVRHIVYML